MRTEKFEVPEIEAGPTEAMFISWEESERPVFQGKDGEVEPCVKLKFQLEDKRGKMCELTQNYKPYRSWGKKHSKFADLLFAIGIDKPMDVSDEDLDAHFNAATGDVFPVVIQHSEKGYPNIGAIFRPKASKR